MVDNIGNYPFNQKKDKNELAKLINTY